MRWIHPVESAAGMIVAIQLAFTGGKSSGHNHRAKHHCAGDETSVS